jgi:hypothetical protein
MRYFVAILAIVVGLAGIVAGGSMTHQVPSSWALCV